MELYLHEQHASQFLFSTDIQCDMATLHIRYELTVSRDFWSFTGLGFCKAESDSNMATERFHGPTTTNVTRSECQTHLPATVNWLHNPCYIAGNLGKSDEFHSPLTADITSLLGAKTPIVWNSAICLPSLRQTALSALEHF
jgi:hypothetical protein